jgi:site-specific DNA recombinase
MSPRNKELLHIYRRVSSKIQLKGYSLEVQLEKGIELSKKLGLGYKDWCEGGKSGSSENIEDREVLMELYGLIQDGVVKNLYVLDLSRLSRNPMVSSLLRVEMEKHEVKLYTDSSELNFGSDESTLMYDFMSSMNQFFVRVQRKKSMLGKLKHFKKGGYRGGTFPMGYKSKEIDGRKKLVIDSYESGYIRKIFEWYDEGKSVKQIGLELDKKGFSPRRGKFWSLGSLQVILQNELYIGIDTMKDSLSDSSSPIILKYENKELQIVDTDLFYRVQNKIKDILSLRRQLYKSKHEVLLRGKLFCGDCGSVWGVRVKPKKNERYYYCRRKENNWREKDKTKIKKCEIPKSINIPITDGIVWNTLVHILSESNILKEVIKQKEMETKSKKGDEKTKYLRELRTKKNVLRKKINSLEERYDEMMDWYLSGDISKQRWEDGKITIENSKSKVWTEYRKIDFEIQKINDKKLWLDWLEEHSEWVKDIGKKKSLDEKRKIVDEYVNRIKVFFDRKINYHRIQISLKIPIVNDKYKLVGTKKGKKDYQILNGSKYFDTEIKPIKVGRKKKVQNEGVVKSNISSDTRIPPTENSLSRSSESRCG